jgi:hypothetical protein
LCVTPGYPAGSRHRRSALGWSCGSDQSCHGCDSFSADLILGPKDLS